MNGPIDWNDGTGPFYPVIAAGTGGSSGAGYSMVDGSFGKGDVDIQTGKAGDQSSAASPEGNFNFASSWFPYAQGWVGGAVANPDASGNSQWENPNAHSPGLESSVVSWPSVGGVVGGTAILSLPGVNSLSDGMVFATSTQGASDVKIVSAAPKADGSSWVVSVRKASESDPAVLAQGLAQFQFVYVPYSAAKLMGGYISASGGTIKGQGAFTVSHNGTGTYSLTLPGKTGTNGVLLLQNASFLSGRTDIADNNFLSYQYQEPIDPLAGTNGTFIIQARHTGLRATFPLTDTSFYFAWVDFTDPLAPPAPVLPSAGPKLNITLSGSTATLTWASSANGFTLETASNLSGSPVVWTSIGTVGQGPLATSYSVPAGSQTQFYRLRK